jgi:protein-S-isoprenylcysteine O-methyltransferase Ste14
VGSSDIASVVDHTRESFRPRRRCDILPPMRPDSPNVPYPPPLFFVAATAAGVLLRRVTPLTIGGGTVRIVTAWLFVGLFAVLLFWSYAWFFRRRTSLIPNRPANALIVEGPFRFTRNPLYLALVLLTIAMALWLNTWWIVILLAPVVVGVDRLVIAREEAYLQRRFGDEYASFRARVRRWL